MSLLCSEVTELVLASAELWSRLAGRRIFLTGASGFFGCWLLETVLFANHHYSLGLEVVALTRDPARFLEKWPHLAQQITLWQGDMGDFPFPEGSFSHVIHGAAEVGSGAGLLEGGLRVLEFTRQCEAERCLLVSSGAVYGSAPGFVTEQHPLAPNTDYGRAKLQLEQAWGLRATIARCFTFIGPYLSLHAGFAASDLLRDALAGRPLQIHGNGLTRRSYLYAGELSVWLWTLLLNGTVGRSYNVGSQQANSVAELADQIAEAAGGLPIQVLGESAGNDYLPDTTRIRTELGLQQRISLPEAVARTWRWLRSTPLRPT